MSDVKFSFVTNVLKVEEKSRILRGWKDKDGNDHFDTEKLGWYVKLEGSQESLYLGTEEPDIKPGYKAKVTIEFHE